jgi:hypothetical protein
MTPVHYLALGRRLRPESGLVNCTVFGAPVEILSSPLLVDKPRMLMETISEKCGKIIANYYIQFARLKNR